MQLVAKNLAATRGGREIFSGLSFAVDAGEALLLTGRNGAGKTTLIRVLAGFLRASEGSVGLSGDNERSLAERCHYVGHLNAVKAGLTVEENLRFWKRFLGTAEGSASTDLEDVLDRFGLDGLRHIPAGYLSAGQKRRLGLARLLVAARPLWLLDEPTVSLDTASQEMLAGVINEHLAGGGLAVAATHLPLGLERARELRLGVQKAAAQAGLGAGRLMSGFWGLVRRDLMLALREGGAVGTALGFYVIVISILPLGLGPDLNLLSRIAPGVLWVALLLAALLSLGRIFANDYEDGSLEVLALGELPLVLVAAAKSLAHWLSTAIPLALLAPVLGLMLNLEPKAYGVLVATMLAGTPAISFLGAIGGALTLQTRRGGLLLALIILPLYIPTLVFGVSAISGATLAGADFSASFMILCAISLVSMVLGPIAAAGALRLQM